MPIKTLVSICLIGTVITLTVGWLTGAWFAAGLGGGVSLLGGVVGLLLVHLSIRLPLAANTRASMNAVMGAVVSGMLLRMALLAGTLGVGIKVLHLSPLPFIASFFLVYLASQILEVLHVKDANGSALEVTT